MSALRRGLRNALGMALACVVIFVLVEGSCSGGLMLWQVTKTPAERASAKHVRFDDELGWINKEGFYAADLYGPGGSVRINGQSLRAAETITSSLTDGRRRILCTGDSFTFGVGAGDEQTWCHRIGVDHPEIQTVNAGEGGYGLAQMTLKSRRLAQTMSWDVHVVAFIADDIRRMSTTDFMGRNKPRARLDQGKLTFGNTPVPEASRAYLWFRSNRGIFEGLRSIQFMSRVLRRASSGSGPVIPSESETADTVLALFGAIEARDRAKGALTVFAFLPSQAHYDPVDERWRAIIAQRAAAAGLKYIDVVAPMRRLEPKVEASMYSAAWRHYSADGHRRVAEDLWAGLNTFDDVRARLSSGR